MLLFAYLAFAEFIFVPLAEQVELGICRQAPGDASQRWQIPRNSVSALMCDGKGQWSPRGKLGLES